MTHAAPAPEFTLDQPPAGTYLQAVRGAWRETGIWDYLDYDASGDLWINGLRVADAIDQYGAPLEIVDTTLVERRCREWADLAHDRASASGYAGRLGFLYAAKANMSSEIVAAALRAGWGVETSAAQEMAQLAWMDRNGLMDADTRVVCNGFKLPVRVGGDPSPPLPLSRVRLPERGLEAELRDDTYLNRILEAARSGWRITPILDDGELDPFMAPGAPRMDVGLRLKFGHLPDPAALPDLVSRFGMTEERLAEMAQSVERADNLSFTTLHAMVGAAETIPLDLFVASLRYAGKVFARLRAAHPSLHELNIGGGIPPLCEPYDHAGFLDGLCAALAQESAQAGVPPPDVTFELGSLVATEAGFHVFRVIQEKENHVAPGSVVWAILDGGLMAAIPDMLFLQKPFRFLAAQGANRGAIPVRLGDTTCDGDGRYPPASFGQSAAVLLPEGPGPHHVVIQGVGAYQEILSGVRGAHHCGLLEAVELVLEEHAPGEVMGRLMPRQSYHDAAAALGYTPGAAVALRAARAARPPTTAHAPQDADPTE